MPNITQLPEISRKSGEVYGVYGPDPSLGSPGEIGYGVEFDQATINSFTKPSYGPGGISFNQPAIKRINSIFNKYGYETDADDISKPRDIILALKKFSYGYHDIFHVVAPISNYPLQFRITRKNNQEDVNNGKKILPEIISELEKLKSSVNSKDYNGGRKRKHGRNTRKHRSYKNKKTRKH